MGDTEEIRRASDEEETNSRERRKAKVSNIGSGLTRNIGRTVSTKTIDYKIERELVNSRTFSTSKIQQDEDVLKHHHSRDSSLNTPYWSDKRIEEITQIIRKHKAKNTDGMGMVNIPERRASAYYKIPVSKQSAKDTILALVESTDTVKLTNTLSLDITIDLKSSEELSGIIAEKSTGSAKSEPILGKSTTRDPIELAKELFVETLPGFTRDNVALTIGKRLYILT
jgi:hypothetical protein